MRRILLIIFSFLFLILAISIFSSPIQANCTTNYDTYGNVISCTRNASDGCSACVQNIDYCYCSAYSATPTPGGSTVTPVPTSGGGIGASPTGIQLTGCRAEADPQGYCDSIRSCRPNGSSYCQPNGDCADTCGVTNASCTGTWGSWGACNSGFQARFCSNNNLIYEIQACQPPTPTGNAGGGGATNTPVPPGSTNTPVVPTNTPIPTPTTGPGPWIKLKDSSFVSINDLYDKVPVSPVAYDSGDTTQPYLIVGSGGVGLASSINITTLNPNAKMSASNWQKTYTASSYSMTAANFLSYIKARKQFTEIASIGQISTDGIYFYNGSDPLNLATVPGEFNQYNIVLVSAGTININMANFNPTKSIAILANTINFSATTTDAKGIFIGSTINTGTTVNQGLKIIGNLAAQTNLVNNRKWTNANIPSLFITFDPSLYLDLLPYLSVANYEWRQLQ